MNVHEIDALTQEKNPPCISIIIPTQHPVKKENYEALKKAMQSAKASLMRKAYAEEIKTSIALKIDVALKTLPSTLLDGLGIYRGPLKTPILKKLFPDFLTFYYHQNFSSENIFN